MWKPERRWEGQDAFIIGGGASLKSFDFSLLKGRNTIGCNDAFRLGEEICHVCMFGDAKWFHLVRHELMAQFHGPIFHCAPSLERLDMPGIFSLHRRGKGLWDGADCGWNFSTGASAINFAINLGAKRVFLLGIDIERIEGQSHWHGLRPRPTKDDVFGRFLQGFRNIGDHLKNPKYAGIQVFHVTDRVSPMPWFMRMPFREFLVVLEKNPPQLSPVWP